MYPLKYTSHLFPVKAGQLISIVGKVISNPIRFNVDLTSENGVGSDLGDISLHISARFDQPYLVRNTHTKGGSWGLEERSENVVPLMDPNPLRRVGNFKIEIFIDEEAYFISIDDKAYCSYKHRLPVKDIKVLNIYGDVETLYRVNQTTEQYRDPWPGLDTKTFDALVPAKFKIGSVVEITATAHGNPKGEFSINFYDGTNRSRTHFQMAVIPQFNRVALSSHNENLGKIGLFHVNNRPFAMNQEFKYEINITDRDFRVTEGNKLIHAYGFKDVATRVLSTLTGIGFVYSNGLYLDIKSIDFKKSMN